VNATLSLPLVALAGCGEDGGISHEDGADLSELSADEVDILLTRLGPLGEPRPDPSNRYADDPDAAQLGREMFYTPRFSGNGEVSCTTCHVPEQGLQDGRGDFVSQGIGGTTPRHALSIIGSAYGPVDGDQRGQWQFWDGRKDSQWTQALGSPEAPIGMGGTRSKLVRVMIEDHRALYESVFGEFPDILFDMSGAYLASDDAKPGEESWDALEPEVQEAINRAFSNYGKAVAAFERTVVCEDSRFDQYWRDLQGGNMESEVLDASERHGLRLFMGKAACIRCHDGPNFTDWNYYNVGIDQSNLESLPPTDKGREMGIEIAHGDPFNCLSPYSDHPNPEECAIADATPIEADLGAFKNPSLRCLELTGPYMHTGSFPTLESVVEFFARGGDSEGFSGESVSVPLVLSEEEQAALVAFLRTLGSEVSYREPRG